MALDDLAPQPDRPAQLKPTLWDQVEAGLYTENVVGSVLSRRSLPDTERPGASITGFRGPPGEEFYAFDHLTDEEKVAHRGRFFDARSLRDVDAIRRQISDETKNREIMAKGPLPEWLIGLTAGIVDPTTYIPVGGQLIKGARVASSVLRVGAEATGGAILQESLLQATQRTRTTEESIASVFMAAALGGGLGFGMGLLRRVPDVSALTRETNTADVTAMLRSTGAGDVGFNPAPLMSSTAVGRFLDTPGLPIIRGMPGPTRTELPAPELMTAMREANPAPFKSADDALAEVSRLQDEIAALEAKGGGIFSEKPKLDEATQARLDDARARAADTAAPARVRADAQREVDSITESTSLERDYSRKLDELDEATARWEKADRELGDYVAEARLELEHLDKTVGPKLEGNEAAKAANDAIEYQRLLDAEFDKMLEGMSWSDVLAWSPKASDVPASAKALDGLTPLTVERTGEGGSLSAAFAPGAWTPTQSEMVGGAKAQLLVRMLAKSRLVAPGLELSASRFHWSRMAANMLVDTGIITKGHVAGLTPGTPMETFAKAFWGPFQMAARNVETHFSEYRKDGGKLSRTEFHEAISRAMRRTDASNIPQVEKAAKEWRTIVDGMTKEAQALGLLPKGLDVKTAASYFTRVYDLNKLRDPAMRDEFRGIVAAWIKTQDVDQKAISDAEYVDAAQSIIDTIMGSPAGRLPQMNHTILNAPNARGPLKERTFMIPDELIEKFLENNSLSVMSYFVRTMGADIAYYKTFKDGNKGLLDVKNKIKEEAEAMSAQKGLSARARIRIDKDAEREMKLIDDLANLARGVKNSPENSSYRGMIRAGRAFRDLNFVRLLGNVLFSSLVDTGKIVMEEGLARTLGGSIREMATGFKGVRLGMREAKLAGTAWDMQGSGRTQAVMDLGERYASTSKVERGLDVMTHAFAQASLLAPWTAHAKGFASSLISSRILGVITQMEKDVQESAAKGVTISRVTARDRRKLAQSFISEEMALRIAGQAKHFDRHPGGLILGNTEAWTDAGARDAFRNALLRDVDHTVMTPGAGDAPIWTSSELGKTLFQFKRFSSAATARVLVAGLQAHDMQAFNGILAMFGIGMFGTFMRDQFNPPKKERTVGGWIKEGIDRSGVISMFMELDSIFDKGTGGWGLARALSGEEASRFVGQGFLERGLGPTAGLVEDTARALSGILNGDLTKSDLHKARRLAPANNLFYTRWAFDQMENGIANTFGLPEKQPRGGVKGRLP